VQDSAGDRAERETATAAVAVTSEDQQLGGSRIVEQHGQGMLAAMQQRHLHVGVGLSPGFHGTFERLCSVLVGPLVDGCRGGCRVPVQPRHLAPMGSDKRHIAPVSLSEGELERGGLQVPVVDPDDHRLGVVCVDAPAFGNDDNWDSSVTGDAERRRPDEEAGEASEAAPADHEDRLVGRLTD
jgi:hypothetical protein